MSGLTSDERIALVESLLPHAWEYPDSFDECGAFINSQGSYALHLGEQVAPTVEQIITARVTAALTEALVGIEAEEALQARCEAEAAEEDDADADVYEQGATVAARCAAIARSLIPTDPASRADRPSGPP